MSGSVFCRTLKQGLRDMGLEISEVNILALEIYVTELKKWNSKINLTAITADNEIAIKHIVDALALAGYIGDRERILDIGSGAGLPAIPLKIVRPAALISSVDAVEKKIRFQRHVARLLGLQGFEAIHARAEKLLPVYAKSFATIVSRAFSSLEMFVALAAPLLADGGRIIAMKGPGGPREIMTDENKLKTLGFEINFIKPYPLPLDMGERCLIGIVPRNTF